MGSEAFILTKNRVLAEVGRALATLGRTLHRRAPVAAPFDLPPKVSRGEAHLGLPWTVLDYPRQFGTDTLAVRSLFWWGRSFSSALHLSGAAAEQARPNLLRAAPELEARGFFVSTGTDPWTHGREEGQYGLLSAGEGLEQDRPFIKIGAWRPLAEWEGAVPWWEENWAVLLRAAGAL